MSTIPLGNLAQNLIARQSQTRIQADLSRLSQELSTGLVSNVGESVRGNTRALTALNRQLSNLDAYDSARSEATLMASSTQTSLSTIRKQLGHVSDGVAALSQSQNPAQYEVVSNIARESFAGIIGHLNTQSAGRQLFAGTSQDGPATRPASDILSDITTLAGAASSAGDIDIILDTYFSDGGAFDTNDYLGSQDDIGPIRIGPDDSVLPTIRADAPDIKEALKAVAKLAILESVSISENDIQSIIGQSIDGMLNSDRGLIGVEAKIGAQEATIDIVASKSAGSRAAYETARLDAIGVDPYATATKLQETQTQLQTLYTLTSRLSGLNLVNFL